MFPQYMQLKKLIEFWAKKRRANCLKQLLSSKKGQPQEN